MNGSWMSMSDQELAAALAERERIRNTVYAEQLSIIAEMSSRGTVADGKGCHPAVWVRQVLRIDRRPA